MRRANLKAPWPSAVEVLAGAYLGVAVLIVGASWLATCDASASPTLTTNLVCSADDSCVASISGPLPIPLPIPVASGGGGKGAAVAGPWTLVNSCALTSDLLCSADDVVFARASAATCDHADGTRTSVTSGNPCIDATWGLRVEGTARTNYALSSDTMSDVGYWGAISSGVAAPTVTANQADDGRSLTTCEKIDLPSVQNAGDYSVVYQTFTATAAAWSAGISVQSVTDAGTVYLYYTPDGVTFHSAACAHTAGTWSRCKLENKTLTAVAWNVIVGVDLRSGSGQSAQGAQSFYACGPQTEPGAWSSSYIPTTTIAVTRAAEAATLAVTGWDPDHTRVTMTTRYIREPRSGQAMALLDASADAASVNGWRADVTSLLEARLQWGDADTWSSADGAPLAWSADTDYAWEILAEVGDSEMLLDAGSQFTAAPAAGDWPAALTTAKLGSWGTAATDMNGWIRALNIYEPTP